VSLVATTTTERAKPSGPKSFSMNSRTSRPRSPTRPITTTSASARGNHAHERGFADAGTGEQAKALATPKGINVSITRIPVEKALLMRWRRNG